jgi:hypothetical protein
MFARHLLRGQDPDSAGSPNTKEHAADFQAATRKSQKGLVHFLPDSFHDCG